MRLDHTNTKKYDFFVTKCFIREGLIITHYDIPVIGGTMTDKNEQVGFHKGALTTLAKEREEFIRLLGVVEQLMQMHLKALKDLGVDLEAEAKKTAPKKLEDALKK